MNSLFGATKSIKDQARKWDARAEKTKYKKQYIAEKKQLKKKHKNRKTDAWYRDIMAAAKKYVAMAQGKPAKKAAKKAAKKVIKTTTDITVTTPAPVVTIDPVTQQPIIDFPGYQIHPAQAVPQITVSPQVTVPGSAPIILPSDDADVVTEFEKESEIPWMWIALGGGALLLVIILAATGGKRKKRKR